jgi:hypothetical protein
MLVYYTQLMVWFLFVPQITTNPSTMAVCYVLLLQATIVLMR